MNIQNRKSKQLKFSNALKLKLIERFGRMPSAGLLANQFNLRARGADPITQEAARRWIKGLSLPQVDRFQILSTWLGIRPHDFLETEMESNSSGQTALNSIEEDSFISLFRGLSHSEKNALQIAAKTMLEAKKQCVNKN